MSIIGSNILAGASGQAGGAGAYQISRSVRFNSSDSGYLSRVFPTIATNQKITYSLWVKRSALGTTQCLLDTNRGYQTSIDFLSSNALRIYTGNGGGVGSFDWTTAQVFRDCSSWYHIVVAWDTTQGSAVNRLKVYVNGAEVTNWSSQETITQNMQLGFSGATVLIGNSLASSYLSAYLADVFLIDSQALDPTSFGEFDTNGVWQPIDASGLTFGTNGFHLPFSDNSTAAALGTDTSGNSNTWTVNNISVTAGAGNDSLVDSPTNGSQVDTGVGGEVVGNYCTLNPLSKGSLVTLANGNLEASATASSGNAPLMRTFGTISPSAGSYYFEVTNLSNRTVGIATAGDTAHVYVYSGGVDSTSGGSATGGGTTYSSSDIIGIALDVTNNSVTFYKNNTQFYQVTGMNSSYKWFPHGVVNSSASASTELWNFGQRQWAYAAPAGFKALCTTNLPEPTIADGSTVMDVALYTGNGSTQTISGLNFDPDLVWIKGRSGATDHALYDTVRTATKQLESNTTTAETTEATGLTAFATGGFSLGALAQVNTSSATYVAWTWDAGSSTVTNTEGSITSQVRANASAGFSVVSWTAGAEPYTVGHGLGVAPSMIITRSRTSVDGWQIGHASIGWTQRLLFDTGAASTTSVAWNDTAPTSTVFTFGATSISDGDMISYCFAPVAGYSSFGSYTGNGSADGPFVYTGFRPKFVIQKQISAGTGGQWVMFDSARKTYNSQGPFLLSDSSAAEGADTEYLDFLSNGFKFRTTNATLNGSAVVSIYIAFAEHPFATARAR